jgi:hypothetical protein
MIARQSSWEAKWKVAHPVRYRRRKLKQKCAWYGITPALYIAALVAQNWACAACGDTLVQVHIDHDHTCCAGKKSCGKCFRGLLCGGCNKALGLLKDTPERIQALYQYRQRFEE